MLASRVASDAPPRDAVAPGGSDVRTWGKGTPFG